MNREIVKMEHISKQFGSNIVLKDVNISLYKGEICAIMGENGAGKSTLMKILAGVYRKDLGSIYFEEKKVEILTQNDAHALGIRMCFEDPQLVENFTVAENIFLGNEITHKKVPLINKKVTIMKATEILNSINCEIDVRKKVKDLNTVQKLMVAVARAIYLNAKVVIIDEPTVTLTKSETQIFIEIINRLIKINVSVILLSHRIEDILSIANRIITMRDGEIIDITKLPDNQMDLNSLLEKMAGIDFLNRYPKTRAKKREIMLEVKNLSNKLKTVNNVSFAIRSGEILGIAGLKRSDKSSLAKLIAGVEKKETGEIYIEGNEVNLGLPRRAIKNGIVYLDADINKNIFYKESAPFNIVISNIKKVCKYLHINSVEVNKISREFIKRLNIKIKYLNEPLYSLSSGTLKKIEISKLLFAEGRIFILEELSAGLDTVSKVEIYNIINKLANLGNCIILVSSDLRELIGMSDRILIMFNGSVIKEINAAEANSVKILYYASGGVEDHQRII